MFPDLRPEHTGMVLTHLPLSAATRRRRDGLLAGPERAEGRFFYLKIHIRPPPPSLQRVGRPSYAANHRSGHPEVTPVVWSCSFEFGRTQEILFVLASDSYTPLILGDWLV